MSEAVSAAVSVVPGTAITGEAPQGGRRSRAGSHKPTTSTAERDRLPAEQGHTAELLRSRRHVLAEKWQSTEEPLQRRRPLPLRPVQGAKPQ